MNKRECKRIINKAVKNITKQSKRLNYSNLEREIKNIVNKEATLYIAYGKVALEALNSSANTIENFDMASEIDVLKELYDDHLILNRADNLK